MKHIVLFALLSSLLLFAQQNNQNNFPGQSGVAYVTSAPSGSCSSGATIQVVKSTGNIYTCQSGTWAQSAGSSVSISPADTSVTLSPNPITGTGTAAVTNPVPATGNTEGGPLYATSTTTGVASSIGPIKIEPYLAANPTDWCHALDLAVAAANTAGINVVDSTGIPSDQPCLTNWLHSSGNVNVAVLVPPGFVLHTEVPLWTPYAGFTIFAMLQAGSALNNGFAISACGPSDPTWNGTACVFTANGGTRTVLAWPQATTPLTFNVHHSVLPAGTYYCVLCLGGQGSTEGEGYNHDGGTHNLGNIAVSCGGVANCIALYTQNLDEPVVLEKLRTGGQYAGTGYYAGVMYDRSEAPSAQAGSGPARGSIRYLTQAGASVANPEAYGVVIAGNNVVVEPAITGCSTQPRIAITSISGGALAGVAFSAHNPGVGCTTGSYPITVNGPPATYGGAFGGTPGVVTAVVSGGVVTSVSVTTPGAGFPASLQTGCPTIEVFNYAGGAGHALQVAVTEDGCIRGGISYVHGVNDNGLVDVGDYAYTTGGSYQHLDSPSAGVALQIGDFADGTQTAMDVFRNGTPIITDNFNSVTLTSTQYPTGNVPFYSAGPVRAASFTTATGNVGTPVTVVDTSTPVTVSTTNAAEFHFNENATAATAITYDLPTAAAGKQFCFSNAYNGSAANTGTLELLTSASGQFIIFTDGTLSATGGYVISGGAAADAACVAGVDSTHWMLYVQRGTWAKH